MIKKRQDPDMVQTPCPQNEAIDEPALIEGLEQGRTWACNALVFNYQDRLLKIAYGITLDHEESREIVQDVFVSAMGSIKNFRGESGLGSWLRKITLNACLNWKRKWKRRFKWHHTSLGPETEFLTYDKAFQGHTPETELKAKQEQMRLVQAVQALPEPLRVVFVLSTLEGLSYQQISAELKIKEGTVSSRLYRARKTIVNGLKANEKEVFHGSLR